MKYDKDMLIGDLLEQAPEKADILLNAGMHCLSRNALFKLPSFSNGIISRSL